MHYDPNLDQSEKFGWKKVCDESRPSEEDQNRWSWYSVLATIPLIKIAILVE